MARYVGFKIGKVHEEHVFSEYYCGGCGFPVTDHDSFCPECGGAFRESDADDAENDRLRELVNSYADLFEKEAATNNGHGPYYSGEDWLVLANDMRVELAKCCGELGIEVGE